MINRHGKGRQHVNVLKSSQPDDIMLFEAVEIKFLELCNTYFRTMHEELSFPATLDADVLRWRTVRARHKQGDYRHTTDELKSTQRIADWTLKIKADLTGTEKKVVEWAT